MYCKIVIPSHKRADRVLSKDLVVDPILCVAEGQADVYREYNPELEIVTHPDSVVGLVAKRNWMVNHFRELFMIDDDVVHFRRLYVKAGESQVIKDKSEITRRVWEVYDLSKQLGISLFGFTKNPRPTQYDEFRPFSLRNMITGCAYGVIQSPNTWWSEELKLKEDFWISSLVMHFERKILTDGRFNFTQKDTFKNPGGLSEIRNTQEELRNILLIRKYFGESIELKKDRVGAKSATRINITAKYKL